jgi:hypothetical protein
MYWSDSTKQPWWRWIWNELFSWLSTADVMTIAVDTILNTNSCTTAIIQLHCLRNVPTVSLVTAVVASYLVVDGTNLACSKSGFRQVRTPIPTPWFWTQYHENHERRRNRTLKHLLLGIESSSVLRFSPFRFLESDISTAAKISFDTTKAKEMQQSK